MNNQTYILSHLAGIFHTGVFCLQEEKLVFYEESPEYNPMREQKERRHTSSYAEQCKDYVYRHYREKIYLDDIADTLGISSSYLSHLFKKEIGVSLQDFVNDVRVEMAANLLIYSGETLSGIAEYVNFPSQSYFGKIFKQKMQMTPKQYRELYKPAEFYDRPEETVMK